MAHIALVGKFSTTRYTYASSFIRVLSSLGHNVTPISYALPHMPMPYLFKKYYGNKKVVDAVTKAQPDLVFVIKGETLSAKSIAQIKAATSAQLMIFYPDNPFSFWNGNANKELLLSLPYYDHFLIWSHMLEPALISAGAKKVHYFPFAHEEELFTPAVTLSPQDHTKFDTDVSFIGTWDHEREAWLTQLITKKPKITLSIWGNRWKDKLQKGSPLRSVVRGSAIYLEEMRKALACSKITLNFIRKQNMTSHNMRTFEALASNAFMLTQRTDEQIAPPFEEGNNIECFGNIEELSKKIDFYLNNDTMRSSIASRGNAIAHKFSLRKQLRTLLRDIGYGKEEY